MIPLLLLTAAFGFTALVLIFIFWRYADNRVKQAYPDEAVNALQEQIDHVLAHQQHLTERVEHLEAIVASEDWDALQDAPEADALPDESHTATNRRRVGRQRSR